jgi:hypothetical protein
MNWSVLAAAVSIAGLPMALIVLYLRSIRETQNDVCACVRRIERDYATKAEWHRDLARLHAQVDRLLDAVTHLATHLRTEQGAVAQLERDRRHLVVMSRRLTDLTHETVKP